MRRTLTTLLLHTAFIATSLSSIAPRVDEKYMKTGVKALLEVSLGYLGGDKR